MASSAQGLSQKNTKGKSTGVSSYTVKGCWDCGAAHLGGNGGAPASLPNEAFPQGRH